MGGDKAPGGDREEGRTCHQQVLLPVTREGATQWVEFSVITKQEKVGPLLRET